MLNKIRKQATKDYVVHPALSIPTGSFLPTLAANFTANIVRNLWSHSVIMCGHFPEGVETFEKRSIDGETRGEWYVRQMLGSANISGSKAMHLMTGNLSHQIEHHLFPDLPSNRYAEIAPKVQALFEKYDLTYHAAPARRRRSTPPGTRSSGSRCPTAGSRPPTSRTPRSSSACSTRWPPATVVRAACWVASSRASPARRLRPTLPQVGRLPGCHMSRSGATCTSDGHDGPWGDVAAHT